MKSLPALIGSWIMAAFCLGNQLQAGDSGSQEKYEKEILPIFQRYCYDCHGDGVKKGELELDRFSDIPSMIANRDAWKHIRDHIAFRLMPPPKEESPSDAERKKLLSWIDDTIFAVDPNNPDPGRVVLRRLNRTEYQNTIQDLLGVSINAAEILPPDDTGYGFDTIADVLTISPAHMDRYLKAARVSLELAMQAKRDPIPFRKIPGTELLGDGVITDEGHLLFKNGQAYGKFKIPGPGTYQIKVNASSDWKGKEPPKCNIALDGNILGNWEVTGAGEQAQLLSRDIHCAKDATIQVGAFFINDFWEPDHPDASMRDRNLTVKEISVRGPLESYPEPQVNSHHLLYGKRNDGQSDEDYMKQVLGKFLPKAFRRPVSGEEVDRYLVFLKHARENREDVNAAIQQALQAMLVSPAFLFREEPIIHADQNGRKLISEHALASRLSYFLWSTMPDDRLRELADAGELRKNLSPEIQRMIASEKSEALVKNFTGQWLQLRDVISAYPGPQTFPDFNHRLVYDMKNESEMLVSHIIRNNLPVVELLDADYTFINEKLAKHYGISNIQGDEFRKVSLIGTPRRGILNQGAFLCLTSYPNRTSPVRRGKYILENILDTPPPPPPPNIPQLTGVSGHGEQISLRAQMEKHRDDPSCSSCHALMDPIGFGLENYDATGAWRDQENGKPIYTEGKFATGESFANAEELVKIIAQNHRAEFHRALASKLLTYSLGRGLDWYDRPTVDQILVKAGGDDIRFNSLIQAIVDSVPFQFRR